MEECSMADKQTEADKAAAMKEYRAQQDAAVDRIAALRAARLERDAKLAAETPKLKPAPAAKKKAASIAEPVVKPRKARKN
jgi:hypothetical protein